MAETPQDDHQTRVFIADRPDCTINSVAWSPDGARVAAAGESSGVTVWRVADGELLLAYGGAMDAVGWSPDGSRIASAGFGPVEVRDAATGELSLTYGETVWALAWAPDGTRVASACTERTATDWRRNAQVWDARTGARLLTYSGHDGHDGHGGTINTLAWSPDGARIATGSGDNRSMEAAVHIWDARTGERVLARKDDLPILAVGWSPDGRRIASNASYRIGSGYYGAVDVWDVATGSMICRFAEHRGQLQALAWSPDGARIASADWDSRVQVWDSATARLLYTYDGHYFGDAPNTGQIRPGTTPRGQNVNNWVWSVAWSPDGTRIASGGIRCVHIWTPE